MTTTTQVSRLAALDRSDSDVMDNNTGGRVEEPDEGRSGASRKLDGWSQRRKRYRTKEKRMMARDFALHDFLVHEEGNAEGQRETVASILVNQGTTPDIIVGEALRWIEKNSGQSPLDLTWYTPGAIVQGSLWRFRGAQPELKTAAQVFLFPGRVDPDLEAVEGPEAVAFARMLGQQQSFTYAYLSTYAFDITTGRAWFQFSREVELQTEIARMYATHKFLFLDSSKFRREGKAAYDLNDLLRTSETVTIYTVSSDRDSWIVENFELLASKCLEAPRKADEGDQSPRRFNEKGLRLRILRENGNPLQIPLFGRFKESMSSTNPHQ